MTRAEVLPAHWLKEYDQTVLPVAMFNCGGCGWPTFTLGDRVRHVNEDGTCPIEPLAKPGLGYLDEVMFFRDAKIGDQVDEHMFVVVVHRLKQDGAPMMWFNGARHSDLCWCIEGPVLDEEVETWT